MNKPMIAKFLGTAVALSTLVAPHAEATLTYSLGSSLGGAAPTGSGPWLTAAFENDPSNANRVYLTLTSSLGASSEFISAVAFNLNPAKNPGSVSILNTTSGNPEVSSLGKGSNNQDIHGGGTLTKDFDFLVTWSTSSSSGGVRRFNGTDTEVFRFSITGLREEDFLFANASGVYFAAKVQGIPDPTRPSRTLSGEIGVLTDPTLPDKPTSGEIGVVPEPSTYLVGAFLLVPFGAGAIRVLRRDRKR